MDVVHIFTAWSELLAFLARERERCILIMITSINQEWARPKSDVRRYLGNI